MAVPHLTYRKKQTRIIIDTIQEALEKQRVKDGIEPFKMTQPDAVDKLIELGSKHKIVVNLLKRCQLTLPE